jgi:hypothetical protein
MYVYIYKSELSLDKLDVTARLLVCCESRSDKCSRSRATMELGLSPHPNDIRVRSLHMSVPWQLAIPTVKDAFLAEVVI